MRAKPSYSEDTRKKCGSEELTFTTNALAKRPNPIREISRLSSLSAESRSLASREHPTLDTCYDILRRRTPHPTRFLTSSFIPLPRMCKLKRCSVDRTSGPPKWSLPATVTVGSERAGMPPVNERVRLKEKRLSLIASRGRTECHRWFWGRNRWCPKCLCLVLITLVPRG